MGRAIVRDPQVFLFDEPLSNLDAKLRVQMRTEIKELHQRLKTTSIYVTHDQIEAMTMADKIVVMRDGIVEQIGAPLELYDHPANLFVAGFIGSPAMNMANVKKFTEKTGIEVRVDNEGWEDVRPKAAVAANTGAGPDIILSTNDDANLYPDKLLDVTDLASTWARSTAAGTRPARPTCKPDGKRLDRRAARRRRRDAGVPREPCEGGRLRRVPEGHRRLPQAAARPEGEGHAGRLRAGQRHRRRQLWCNWLLWSHGGKLVDEKNKVVIDSPETIKALEYAKEMYATFAPGTLSWLDPNNNKAFLDGQVSLTNNGISVYYAAKNSTDPKVKEMKEDIHHAQLPDRAGGRADRVAPVLQPDDHEVHEVPAGGEGVPALHDGEGAVRPVAARRRRLHRAAARRLRVEDRPIWTSTRSTRRTATA
jgi:hypothetical protein